MWSHHVRATATRISRWLRTHAPALALSVVVLAVVAALSFRDSSPGPTVDPAVAAAAQERLSRTIVGFSQEVNDVNPLFIAVFGYGTGGVAAQPVVETSTTPVWLVGALPVFGALAGTVVGIRRRDRDEQLLASEVGA